MTLSRAWAMPHSETFSVPPIGEFVQRHLNGARVIVDPFARNASLGTITNDLNPATTAQYHMDALAFLKKLEAEAITADAILFDPPYSPRQAKECYESVGLDFTQRDGQVVGRWTEHKQIISRLLKPDGIAISFGWNSQGLNKKNGFDIVEILLVCHGGAHNDTICVAERKI